MRSHRLAKISSISRELASTHSSDFSRCRIALLLVAGVALPLLATATGQAASPRAQSDVNITNDLTRRWGESAVAINPKNPNNIVIATQGHRFTSECQAKSPDCQMVPVELAPGLKFPQPRGQFTRADFNVITAFVSFDRGKSWKRVSVPSTPRNRPNLKTAGDPHVAATPDGTFYFSFDELDWNTVEKPLPSAGVGVSKSVDGGRTWSVPVLTGTPADGPKMAADLITGTLYEASSSQLGPKSTGDPTVPLQPTTDRWLVSSKDGVQWTKPQPMHGGGFIAAAHGILATSFRTQGQANIFGASNNELCGDAPKPCTIFETTTNAGASWTPHIVNVPSDAAGGFGGGSMVAADPTRKGHFALAVPMKASGGFLIFQTPDAGNSWTGPVSVTEAADKQHFLSWMTYSSQGVLAIMWRTRQPVAGQAPVAGEGFGAAPVTPYNVWAAISRDGGASFSAPLKVSSKDSPAGPTGSFTGGDDYSGLAVDRNAVYLTWADWRSKERANFFRAIPLAAFGPATK